MSGDEQSKLPTDDDGGLPPNLSKDLDLAREQEYAELTKQYEVLKAKWADERTRNERLQMRSEEHLEEIRKKDAELEKYEGLSNGGDTGFLDSLAHRIEEQENLIARHEADAEVNRVNKERYEKELANLRPLARIVEELKDKVKDLESDNNELTKTANKVGKYEEKLKRVNVLEKENKQLRDYNSTLENNQVTFDQTQASNERLEQENAAFRRKMETYEAEIFELQGLKQHFENECRTKDAAIEVLEAKKASDDQYIADLHEQINTNTGPPHSPDSPSATTGGMNLGAELEQSEGHPNYALEISRLRAEIQLLKTNTAGTANATLRADLENAQRLVERLQTQVHELTELHAIGQEQLNALISEASGEKLVKITDRLMHIGALQVLTPGFYRNEAIASSRRRYLEANQKLTEANKQVNDLQRELADRDRQLLAARAECKSKYSVFSFILANEALVNAMDKEDIDALDELKSANETIIASLRSDLLVLQGQYNALDADYSQQKTQLVDALLKKDKAIEDLANAKDILNVNDEVLWAKQRAEQKLRDEKEKSQNEVSRQNAGASEPPKSPRKSRFLGILKPLRTLVRSTKHPSVAFSTSKHQSYTPSSEPLSVPDSPTHQAASTRPVTEPANNVADADILEAETGLFWRPPISPSKIPLPASPPTELTPVVSRPRNAE